MKHTRNPLKTVFVTLFLDLAGFSIIFPLFPAMMEYYLAADTQNTFLRTIVHFTHALAPQSHFAQVVLFGGILGALYSLLQFIFAPVWGTLSDRMGRKPVLIISLAGSVLCYLLWTFAGSFTLLILSRVIGGIMAGNISTATAVVGDVTSEKDRSRGMATVGIAIGLGFILGPAMGGVSSLVRLDLIFPKFIPSGLNPFSMPACVACFMAFLNLVQVWLGFQETLPVQKRVIQKQNRSANPLKLFKPLPQKEINIANFAYFLFLTAFSGMEFTLTFLAVERLGYSSFQNSMMFVFVGVLMALIQGGYVRRKAHDIGEKRMALQGMFLALPGFVLLAGTQSVFTLYLGLTFIALSSAMIIPCLTALVSLFATPQTQGQAIGIFRSMGSLARVMGPFAACLAYWKFGSTPAYLLGACFIIIPIVLLSRVHQSAKEHTTSHTPPHPTPTQTATPATPTS